MNTIRATTDPGLEDIAATEIAELLCDAGIATNFTREKAFDLAGVVTAQPAEEADIELLRSVLCQARSVYHIVVHIGEVKWAGQPLAELASAIASLPLRRLSPNVSFRVSCSRVGEHPFHSPDVEREVGSAIQARFLSPVDLTQPDVNVRVDIVGEQCLCGYQLTGKKGLDRRYRRPYHPRVTLRTTVAYAMLKIAGYLSYPGDLLDPFCGSGTLLLEAASLVYRPDEQGALDATATLPRLLGCDIRGVAADGCRDNARAAGFDHAINIRRADALDLSSWCDRSSLDYIVTNPPFGIRLAANRNLSVMYAGFLEQAVEVLRPGGTLAMLVAKRRGRFNKVLSGFDALRIEHVRIIEIGGVYPGLFVIRRV